MRVTDVDRDIRSYVGAVLAGCSADRVTDVRRFTSGENHAVFKLSYRAPDDRTRSVVVRIASSERAHDCATATREATVLDKVRGFAAPALYDFRCASQWFDAPTMCMQFVEGEQRGPVAPEDFERLGYLVGRLHALPTDDLDGWPDATLTPTAYLDTRVTKIVERLRSVRDPLPRSVQRRIRRAVLVMSQVLEHGGRADLLHPAARLVLLHGDVAGGNIMWDPEPVLIDWEYARIGDAADEVAYIFNQNDVTQSQRGIFWRGYRAACDPAHALEPLVERVRWWEPVTVLGSALFWVELWSRRADADADGHVDRRAPREQDYYGEQTLRRLDRLDVLFGRLLTPGKAGEGQSCG